MAASPRSGHSAVAQIRTLDRSIVLFEPPRWFRLTLTTDRPLDIFPGAKRPAFRRCKGREWEVRYAITSLLLTVANSGAAQLASPSAVTPASADRPAVAAAATVGSRTPRNDWLDAALASASREGAGSQQSLRSLVCKYHRPVPPGDGFSLMTLPTPHRDNESGVLLLVNCSNRRVISLRDPSHSPRHAREYLYNPLIHARLPHDPNHYEIINFNKEEKPTPFDHTAYSSQQGWTGPCVFKDLELTTADDEGGISKSTVTVSIDICKNHILVLLSPPV
jgi:hypothetical protein